MIDFQSSAIAERPNHWPCNSPSPEGEGELYRGRHSVLIELRPCPSGTLETTQQHARVIYGWVHRLCALCASVAKSVSICVYPWLNLPLWRPKFANLCKAVQSCASLCKGGVRGRGLAVQGLHVPFKVSQGHSRLLKPTQAYSRVCRKKIVFCEDLPPSTFSFQPLPRYTWCNHQPWTGSLIIGYVRPSQPMSG
jgi:hypothetical protein